MLFLVCGLVEYRFATLYRALEGLLSCVNSEMVEQIVPFGEQFITAVVLAEEGSGEAGC